MEHDGSISIDTRCPHCLEPLDSGFELGGATKPSPNTVAFCCYCGAVSLFDWNGQLRAPTIAEVRSLMADPETRRLAKIVRQVVNERESAKRRSEDEANRDG